MVNPWRQPHPVVPEQPAAVVAQVELQVLARQGVLQVLAQQGVLRALVRQVARRQVVAAARVEQEPLQPAPLAEASAAAVAPLRLSLDAIPRHSAN